MFLNMQMPESAIVVASRCSSARYESHTEGLAMLANEDMMALELSPISLLTASMGHAVGMQ